eukprot:4033959-Prymnesium_polylepis.1
MRSRRHRSSEKGLQPATTIFGRKRFIGSGGPPPPAEGQRERAVTVHVRRWRDAQRGIRGCNRRTMGAARHTRGDALVEVGEGGLRDEEEGEAIGEADLWRPRQPAQLP